jgi:putative ABC transport system substrate-binding protein
MERRRLLLTSLIGLLAAPSGAGAQPAGRIARIGWLTTTPPPPHIWNAFIDGLREHGWVEGRSIVFEKRFSYGRAEKFPALAAELVGLKVDVIITSGTPASLAAKAATTTVPIVMGVVIDAVGTGLVASLARPGGNVTGISWLGPELHAKRLELFKEAVPTASRVAILSNPANPGHALAVRKMQAVATGLGLTFQVLDVSSPGDLDAAFTAMKRSRPDGLFPVADPLYFAERTRILEFAAKSRLPAIYEWREFVDQGGLMSYGPSIPDLFRRAAVFYIDRILRGTRPADLPVEQVTRFELVVNLKTARTLGLTIPSSLLLRANSVIE